MLGHWWVSNDVAILGLWPVGGISVVSYLFDKRSYKPQVSSCINYIIHKQIRLIALKIQPFFGGKFANDFVATIVISYTSITNSLMVYGISWM